MTSSKTAGRRGINIAAIARSDFHAQIRGGYFLGDCFLPLKPEEIKANSIGLGAWVSNAAWNIEGDQQQWKEVKGQWVGKKIVKEVSPC